MYLRLLGSTTGDAYGNESGPMISMGEQPAIFQGMSMNEPMLMNPMMRMGHGVQLEEWFYSNQAVMESFQSPEPQDMSSNE